ncbi:MAG: protein arginine kinase [Ignavibacteriales bacterium]
MSIENQLQSSYTSWMDAGGPESDIVVTSRIRLARNLTSVPFPHMLADDTAAGVIEQVGRAVQDIPDLKMTLSSELSHLERQMLLEKHLISKEQAETDSKYRGVICNESGSIVIMVNEEDHLRIQSVLPGLQLNQAYKYADDIDNSLEKGLEYAFDEQIGYLTSCPTNVGTGMRASVMLHLPAIAMTNQQGRVFNSVAPLGLTVRGIYGEGTETLGNLYQLSNQVTLGQNEEDIINNLWTVTLHILDQERSIRERMLTDMHYQIEDRVWRSFGVVTNAKMITSSEALALLSDVRLGSDLRILPNLSRRVLNELIVAIRPAHLQKAAGRDMASLERDLARSEVIKSKITAGGQEG